MTNGFLVSVPHERLHGTISILEQRPELPTNVQSAGSLRHNAAHRLLHVYRTTCTATAWGPLALQVCLAQQARNGSPSEIASITATWKEAWECQNRAQNAIGSGKRTMQSTCTIWLPWTEPALGTHADHPKFAVLTFPVCLET